MKFELQNKRPDGAYDLQVKAESPQDVVRMNQVMRVFNLNKVDEALAYAEAIQLRSLSRTLDHPVMPVTCVLKGAFAPYAKELGRITGGAPSWWGFDLTELFGGLQHQYVALTVTVNGDDVVMEGYGLVWERKEPAVLSKVTASAADYLQEKLGWRKCEPEFRETAGGLYKHNEDYARIYHKSVPGLGNGKLWDLVFEQWRRRHATPGQLAVLENSDALAGGYAGHDYHLRPLTGYDRDRGGVYGCQLTILDPNGDINWDGKGMKARHVKWEEFRKL